MPFIVNIRLNWKELSDLELLSQFGGQLVAGELFPGYHVIVLDQLFAIVSAPLQAILIQS